MDAAAAARMSDPLMNPHFRRRWTEVADERVPDPPALTEAPAARLAQLADLLRAEWQRQRASAKGRDP
jgi:hypothetical protein